MSAKIYVPVIDAWDFYWDNQKRMNLYVEIAKDDDTTIYMTDCDGHPQITVEFRDKEIYVEQIHSSLEMITRLQRIYEDFIIDSEVEIEESEEDAETQAMVRDDELICATDDFLNVLLSPEEYDELLEDMGADTHRMVLESICDVMYEHFGINVYWPLTREECLAAAE